MKLSILDIVALILVIVGGLNWGLVGLLKIDLVALIFGTIPMIQATVYILVGLSAIYLAAISMKLEKK